MIIVFAAFTAILLCTVGYNGLAYLGRRTRDDWLLDVSGLVIQGIVIPLLQTIALYQFFSVLSPSWRGALEIPAILSFLIAFVGVDYLYYWNHRILHGKSLWPFHQVHHSAEQLDFLVTSRNSLWSPFLLVYLWVHGFFIFLLRDPSWYIAAVSLTAALDLWRHMGFGWEPPFLARILVTPKLHAHHHGRTGANRNYAANFVLWDMIHGTYEPVSEFPKQIGIQSELSLGRKLLYPFAEGNHR